MSSLLSFFSNGLLNLLIVVSEFFGKILNSGSLSYGIGLVVCHKSNGIIIYKPISYSGSRGKLEVLDLTFLGTLGL
jgi:hypothetical protein